MKFILPITFFVAPLTLLLAEESVSNADLSRKLELILGKIGSLEERVGKLESENADVKKDVELAVKSANEATQLSKESSIPRDDGDKKSFLKNLRNQLRTDEVLSQGPWTKRNTWESIKRNMTSFQVRNLLGNPSNIKKSNNPRIEQVYIYSGDLNADGDVDIGKVNFFRDRLQSFESPFN